MVAIAVGTVEGAVDAEAYPSFVSGCRRLINEFVAEFGPTSGRVREDVAIFRPAPNVDTAITGREFYYNVVLDAGGPAKEILLRAKRSGVVLRCFFQVWKIKIVRNIIAELSPVESRCRFSRWCGPGIFPSHLDYPKIQVWMRCNVFNRDIGTQLSFSGVRDNLDGLLCRSGCILARFGGLGGSTSSLTSVSESNNQKGDAERANANLPSGEGYQFVSRTGHPLLRPKVFFLTLLGFLALFFAGWWCFPLALDGSISLAGPPSPKRRYGYYRSGVLL